MFLVSDVGRNRFALKLRLRGRIRSLYKAGLQFSAAKGKGTIILLILAIYFQYADENERLFLLGSLINFLNVRTGPKAW
jgi:hypothetical protein